MSSAFQYLDLPAVLILFFILHLIAGAVLPYKKGHNPFMWSLMESAGLEMDRRLNRPGRGSSELFVRGLVTMIVMGVFGFIIAAAVVRLTQYPYGWLSALVLLFLCISVMPGLKLMRAVLEALNKKDNKKAADALQSYFRDDLSKVDHHTLVRRALELSAVRLNQYLVAPVLFFVFFGAVGLTLYVTFIALFDAFGTRDLQHVPFGRMARIFEKILNFIPAKITALLIMLAAIFVSRSNPLRSAKTIATQSAKDRVRNRGWLLAAMAGSLGVTLNGPVRDAEDHVIDNGWIGPAGTSAKATLDDLKRGAMLHFVVFIGVIILASLYFALYYVPIME